jgi:tetratricopeptide (TPR) repeat protein
MAVRSFFHFLARAFSSRRLIVGLLVGLAIGALAWRRYANTRPESLLQRGQAALHAGDVDGAWQAIASLEERGHQDEARLLHAELLFRSQRFAEALALLSAFTDQSTFHLQALRLSGRCLLELGACVEAERLYLYLLSLRPDDPEPFQGLAAAYFDLGALPRAAAACRQWAKLQPASAAAHRFHGVILKELARFPEAIEAYQTAVALGLPPDQKTQALDDLLLCQIHAKQYREALTTVSQLAPDHAQKPSVLELHAEALRGVGEDAEAGALLDNLLTEHPGQINALRLRALLHLDQGQPDRGRVLLEKAVTVAPRKYDLRVHLAQAYAALGNQKAAEEQRRHALELEKILRELSELTYTVAGDYQNPKHHERMALLYTELHMPHQASKCEQIARMLRERAAKKD